MEDEGFQFTPSPRDTIKKAFQEGIINDEEIWLEILNKRNQLNHTYNEELANVAAESIINSFHSVINNLLQTLIEIKKSKYDKKE